MEILLTSLSSIGITHALFIAALLWFWKRGNRYLNRVLSVLLVAFAVRTSKSLLFFLLEQTPEIAPAFGVTGQAAIGPALFLYVREFLGKDREESRFQIKDLIHFVPAVIILSVIPFHTEGTLHYTYIFVIAHLFGYWCCTAAYVYSKNGNLKERESTNWLTHLLVGSFIIWCVYLSQLFSGSTLFYLAVTSISAFTLFWLSFKAMLNYNVLSRIPDLSGNNTIHGVSIDELTEKVEQLFKEDKVFTDPNLTLDSLAEQVDTPSYIISKVINHRFHQSFPEYVNTYRIREAERWLRDPSNKHFSIEAIAFECGFNNLSAFYNVFKKFHDQTPAELREQSVPT